MNDLRTLLTHDHRMCDDLLAQAEEAAASQNLVATKQAFADFVAAMAAHFEAEEQTLFPAFEAATGMSMGPTQVMRLEHVQMRNLFQAAVDALQTGNFDEYSGQIETLVIMMQQHNMKEENILYPMCDQHLGSNLAEIVPALKARLLPA